MASLGDIATGLGDRAVESWQGRAGRLGDLATSLRDLVAAGSLEDRAGCLGGLVAAAGSLADLLVAGSLGDLSSRGWETSRGFWET